MLAVQSKMTYDVKVCLEVWNIYGCSGLEYYDLEYDCSKTQMPNTSTIFL